VEGNCSICQSAVVNFAALDFSKLLDLAGIMYCYLVRNCSLETARVAFFPRK